MVLESGLCFVSHEPVVQSVGSKMFLLLIKGHASVVW